MKNAILFVPHPDDELLVGGGMLYALAHDTNWQVKVVFVTNGDFYAYQADIRLCEAIKACQILGVEERNVIFLGYGDGWKNKHVYNSDSICVSNAGRIQTYALEFHPEYAYQKFGIHNYYTKANIKKDMRTIIEDDLPDVMICVDFDVHPDHRATSLIFTEVIHDILVENEDYHPLILKKLAYENVMYGQEDYYHIPHLPTVNVGNNLISTPVLKWDNRVCFKVPPICDCLKLTQNPIFKAAAVYKTQKIKLKMIRSLNCDIVYWRFPSENSALQAEIETSSGSGKYLNDLKIIDCDDLTQECCRLDCAVWKPVKEDKEKSAKLIWKDKTCVHIIVFFENPDLNCNIEKARIILDGKAEILVSDVKHDGAANIIILEKTENISMLEFQILEGSYGSGLSEIMTFDNPKPIEKFGLPCDVLDANIGYEQKGKKSLFVWLDYLYFRLIEIIAILWPNQYVLMRNYPICRTKKYLMPLFKISHWIIKGTELLIKG